MPTSLFKLFATFFRIGLFTFGGGYAMIPLLERDIVQRNAWIKPAEFTDLLALAQSAPGVFAVNMAVFVGYRLRGVTGAVAAAFGCALPSVVIILLIVFVGVSPIYVIIAAGVLGFVYGRMKGGKA